MNYFRSSILPKLLCNHFLKLCKTCHDIRQKTSDEKAFLTSLKQILEFLINVRDKCGNGECELNNFKSEVLKTDDEICLDIIWLLHNCKLLSFDEFLTAKSINGKHLKYLDSLACFYVSSVYSRGSLKNIMMEELSVVVLDSEILDNPTHNYKITFIMHLLVKLKESDGYSNCYLVWESLKSKLTPASMLKFAELFCTRLFTTKHETFWLKLLQDSQSKLELNEDILKILEGSVCDFDHWIDVIKTEVLVNKYVDCNVLDNFLNLCLNNNKGNNIKQMLNHMIEGALVNEDNDLLAFVFYVSRKCSNHDNFMNYSVWFGSCFSVESSRPISSSSKCKFFIDFLTEMVLTDSPYYLKVHINKAPLVPQTCQSIFSDYVSLAKSRLSSLNHSFNLGLFEHKNETESNVNADVDIVLKHFEKTGEVPKSLLEASIFQKNYYDKHFLKHLLFDCKNKIGIKEKFISKLISLGKVPTQLLEKYKEN